MLTRTLNKNYISRISTMSLGTPPLGNRPYSVLNTLPDRKPSPKTDEGKRIVQLIGLKPQALEEYNEVSGGLVLLHTKFAETDSDSTDTCSGMA